MAETLHGVFVRGRARSSAIAGRTGAGRSELSCEQSVLSRAARTCPVQGVAAPRRCAGVALFYPTGSRAPLGAASNCIAIKFHLARRPSATLRIALLLSGIYCPSPCGAMSSGPTTTTIAVSRCLLDASQKRRALVLPRPNPAPPCRPMGALETQHQSAGERVASRRLGLGSSG